MDFSNFWPWMDTNYITITKYISDVHLQKELLENRIEYRKHWLMLFEKMVKQKDRALTTESGEVVKMLRRHLRSKNKKYFNRYLDVGVGTGRYPILLGNNDFADNISAVDIDTDVEVYMEMYNPNIPFTLADIRSPEIEYLLPNKFDLITCMLGTASHFGLKKRRTSWNKRTGFEQGLYNMLNLLDTHGLLVFSVWSHEATVKRDLLNIMIMPLVPKK